MDPVIPKFVFIVPYRNRENHRLLFERQMKYLMEDIDPADYRIIYAHQCDTRIFNRGAMKNIGFLAMKKLYPRHYQSMTFVFHDVDTMPYIKNTFDYKTVSGVVKHFYGFLFALGGIVSITGYDFEKVNGFPNFWAWGYEDNELQRRVQLAGILIDRSQFCNINHENILQIYHGKNRLVNRAEADKYKFHTFTGLNIINNVEYKLEETTGFLNITNFNVGGEENKNLTTVFDLTSAAAPFQTRPTPMIKQNLSSTSNKKNETDINANRNTYVDKKKIINKVPEINNVAKPANISMVKTTRLASKKLVF